MVFEGALFLVFVQEITRKTKHFLDKSEVFGLENPQSEYKIRKYNF